MAITATSNTSGALVLGELNKNANSIRFGTETQNDSLAMELDLYIKQNYRSADFCLKDIS